MSSQNNIPKRFSENNNAVFTQYAVLLGTFLGFISVYVLFFRKEIIEENSLETFLWFSTITLMIVWSFIAILSVSNGYARRRDHVVTCVREIGEEYPAICGNGRGKCLFNFLLGAYNIFFWFFFLTLPAFVTFSIFLFSKMNYCGKGYIIAIGSVLWIIDILALICHYCKYLQICEKARIIEHQKTDDKNSSCKNVIVNINC